MSGNEIQKQPKLEGIVERRFIGLIPRALIKAHSKLEEGEKWVYDHSPDFMKKHDIAMASVTRFTADGLIGLSGIFESIPRALGASTGLGSHSIGVANSLFGQGKDTRVEPVPTTRGEQFMKQFRRLAHPIKHPIEAQGVLLMTAACLFVASSYETAGWSEGLRGVSLFGAGASFFNALGRQNNIKEAVNFMLGATGMCLTQAITTQDPFVGAAAGCYVVANEVNRIYTSRRVAQAEGHSR